MKIKTHWLSYGAGVNSTALLVALDRGLACAAKSSGELFQGVDPDPPCACFDGADD